MHLMTLLHRSLKKQLPFIHKRRYKSFMEVCSTAISSPKLTLTGLGRAMVNANKPKSNIQKLDRLLGNRHLQHERMGYYKSIINHLLHKQTQALIHVDWSCINAKVNLYLVRASLSMSGRSITIYEESHPKAHENNHSIHKAFLEQLNTFSKVPSVIMSSTPSLRAQRSNPVDLSSIAGLLRCARNDECCSRARSTLQHS